MGLKVLRLGKYTFKKLKHLYITPYIDRDTLGFVKYDVRAIVADSVSLEQEDNDVNAKYSEFNVNPVIENVTLGKFKFSATCVDFQNTIMKELFGYNSSSTIVSSPKNYKEILCAVELNFGDSSQSIVIPHVKLNANKVSLSNLKSDCATGIISGTAYPRRIKLWYDNGDSDVGTGPVFLMPNGKCKYDIYSDYGYLLWDDGSRIDWNGSILTN